MHECSQYSTGRLLVPKSSEDSQRSPAALVGRTGSAAARAGWYPANGRGERSFQANHSEGNRECCGKRKLIAEEGRVRKAGGGRKPVEMHDPDITRLLEQVMDESTVGDPMSPL